MNETIQAELLDALVNLQKQIRAHHKMNIKKDYSLMVADAQASKVIRNVNAALASCSTRQVGGVGSDARNEILKAVTAIASVVDDNEQTRLDAIQRLASWSPARAEKLDDLLAEAKSLFPTAPVGFTQGMLRTFEVTGAGFDGGTNATDDRVFWVQALSADLVRQAIDGTGAEFHDAIDGDSDIDFRLPAEIGELREALIRCLSDQPLIWSYVVDDQIGAVLVTRNDGATLLFQGDDADSVRAEMTEAVASDPDFVALFNQYSVAGAFQGGVVQPRIGDHAKGGAETETVGMLKQRGFEVSSAPDAIGCTEVKASERFHYFNPRFLDDATDIVAKLYAADPIDGGQFRIIVAGEFADSAQFPFEIVTAGEAAEIFGAHSALRVAQDKRDEAIAAVGRAGAALCSLVFNTARKPVSDKAV